MLSRSSVSSSAIRLQVESALAHRVPSALTVREKPAPEVFPTGIVALDELTGMGGLPRSALTEICGPASSGRTSVLLSLLAQATSQYEACALIDASDAFHPESAQNAGLDLERLLWVRCGLASSSATNEKLSPLRTQRNTKEEKYKIENEKYKVEPKPKAKTDFVEAGQAPSGSRFRKKDFELSPPRTQGNAQEEKYKVEPKPKTKTDFVEDRQASRDSRFRKKDFGRLEQALKATDLLLQSGGFGLLVVDLADIAPDVARRVPLTSWFRFRRVVEETSTALVVLEHEPFARTCASLVLRLRHKQAKWSGLLASAFYAHADHNCAASSVVPSHSRLLGGLQLDVEVTRSRKGPQSTEAVIMTRTAWAG